MKEKQKYYLEIEEKCENLEVNKRVRAFKDNSDTLKTYWEIGELLVAAQGGKERAKYGNNLIKEWSEKLSNKLGKTYNARTLRRMRQYYLIFPKWSTLSTKLNWALITELLPIKNEK